MSRRNKNSEVKVELRDTSRSKGSFEEMDVVIKNKVIGTVSQEKGKPAQVKDHSGNVTHASSIEEGIQKVIMDYNLHNG